MADFEQIVSMSKTEDLLRTYLDTGRSSAIFETRLVAENTFFNNGIEGTRITVGRNIEGTERWCRHSAADTNLGVVNNRPFPGFGIGIDKAGSRASRLITVVALNLAEDRNLFFLDLITIYHRIGFFGRAPFFLEDRLVVKRCIRFRKVLLLVAGRLATATANASRRVHQDPHAVRIPLKRVHPPGVLRSTKHRGGPARHTTFKKIPSIHDPFSFIAKIISKYQLLVASRETYNSKGTINETISTRKRSSKRTPPESGINARLLHLYPGFSPGHIHRHRKKRLLSC